MYECMHVCMYYVCMRLCTPIGAPFGAPIANRRADRRPVCCRLAIGDIHTYIALPVLSARRYIHTFSIRAYLTWDTSIPRYIHI